MVQSFRELVFLLASVVKAVGSNSSYVTLLMGLKGLQVCSDLPLVWQFARPYAKAVHHHSPGLPHLCAGTAEDVVKCVLTRTHEGALTTVRNDDVCTEGKPGIRSDVRGDTHAFDVLRTMHCKREMLPRQRATIPAHTQEVATPHSPGDVAALSTAK